jgi:UDP-glucose 4-epimerase|tara:strand:- start:1363 stop:1605 length:243 start_codon:yes stop_codon:yes gene_type:complete
MTNIYKELIEEASHSYTWLDNLSDGAKEFLTELGTYIKQGNKANATKLQEILEREFDVKISHSTANRWIKQQYKEAVIDE